MTGKTVRVRRKDGEGMGRVRLKKGRKREEERGGKERVKKKKNRKKIGR